MTDEERNKELKDLMEATKDEARAEVRLMKIEREAYAHHCGYKSWEDMTATDEAKRLLNG